MANLQLELLTMCDYALTSQEGKLSLLGIFDRMFVAQTPATFARFFIVAAVAGQPESNHQLTLSIESPTNQEVLPPKKFDITLSPAGKTNIITDIVNCTLPESGEYRLVIKDATVEIGAKSFIVTRMSHAHEHQRRVN